MKHKNALSACPCGDAWGTPLQLNMYISWAPTKTPRGQTLRRFSQCWGARRCQAPEQRAEPANLLGASGLPLIYIYIYIFLEREREIYICVCVYIYIYMYKVSPYCLPQGSHHFPRRVRIHPLSVCGLTVRGCYDPFQFVCVYIYIYIYIYICMHTYIVMYICQPLVVRVKHHRTSSGLVEKAATYTERVGLRPCA